VTYLPMIGVAILFLASIALVRMMRAKRANARMEPALGDIASLSEKASEPAPYVDPLFASENTSETQTQQAPGPSIIALHVLADDDTPMMGYDLLQALLSEGLHFGDMQIFHRFEDENQDNVLFSVAQATEPGTFDIEHIGSTSCRGLTFFMSARGDEGDLERFELMLTTAQQFADDFQATLCNDKRKALTDDDIDVYELQLSQVFA